MLTQTELSTNVVLDEVTNPDMYWHLPVTETENAAVLKQPVLRRSRGRQAQRATAALLACRI